MNVLLVPFTSVTVTVAPETGLFELSVSFMLAEYAFRLIEAVVEPFVKSIVWGPLTVPEIPSQVASETVQTAAASHWFVYWLNDWFVYVRVMVDGPESVTEVGGFTACPEESTNESDSWTCFSNCASKAPYTDEDV